MLLLVAIKVEINSKQQISRQIVVFCLLYKIFPRSSCAAISDHYKYGGKPILVCPHTYSGHSMHQYSSTLEALLLHPPPPQLADTRRTMQKSYFSGVRSQPLRKASAIHVVGEEEVLPSDIACYTWGNERMHEGDAEPECQSGVLLPHRLTARHLIDPDAPC